jgi:hypothetical protein
MIMFHLQGLYLWRKILTENFDSRVEHCFSIKLNQPFITLVLYINKKIKPLLGKSKTISFEK